MYGATRRGHVMNWHDRIRTSATYLFPLLLCSAVRAEGGPSKIETIAEGVLQVGDEAGNWGGPTMGITHQRGPHYWAKKMIDLSGLAEEAWARVDEIRLSAHFCVRDYSWRELPQANGLDEAIELVVNGRVHRIPTSEGLPVYLENKSMASVMRWHDFILSKDEIERGPNEIIFRMAPVEGKSPDDYLYLGIDNTASGGNSFVRFSADAPWRQDALTIPGGRGEYMVRLYLLSGPRSVEARWTPTDAGPDDPHGMIRYAGSHGPTTRIEWDPRRIDPLESVGVRVETDGPEKYSFAWLDGAGTAVSPAEVEGPVYRAKLEPPLTSVPSGIELPNGLAVRSITLEASAAYHRVAPRVDMAPRMEPPAGKPAARTPSCRIEEERITLANDNLRSEFTRAGGRLRLASLHNEITASQMVRRPEDVALWLIEVGGKRYAGSRDFVCRSVDALAEGRGFRATCLCEAIGLEKDRPAPETPGSRQRGQSTSMRSRDHGKESMGTIGSSDASPAPVHQHVSRTLDDGLRDQRLLLESQRVVHREAPTPARLGSLAGDGLRSRPGVSRRVGSAGPGHPRADRPGRGPSNRER